MKQKRMSAEQYIEIGDWLRQEKDHIRLAAYQQEQVRQLCSARLGYEIPFSSLVRCAKAVGVQWAGSPVVPEVPIDHEAIVILIGAIAGLYVETGKTVPDNLANLQSMYVRAKGHPC